jgi:hypothetical protein
VARAPRREIHGRDKTARFIHGAFGKGAAGATITLEVFNGQLGMVARLDGRAIGAVAVTVADNLVQTLHLVANPDKLRALDTVRGVALE